MPRKKVRKSSKGTHTQEEMKRGLALINSGRSARSAAKECNVNYKTLARYYKKSKESPDPDNLLLTTNYRHRLVFSTDLEQEIASFVRERSTLGYGLTKDEVREIAYEVATTNQLKVPPAWTKNSKAGLDWFAGFMNRHPILSCRTPEQCSVARAACFNKPVIQAYFKKLYNVIARHPSFADGTRLYNADETATSTVGVMKKKVVATKGVKQVHQIKGQERGTTVTTLFYINASGSFLPPVMIFPRQNFNSGMLKDCYPNTLGLATKSGWMTKEMFVPSLKHFIRLSASTKDHPTLLVVDNVESHLSVEAIRLCKENGVVLFTLPPHTTHKTQPLDVGVYGPFKNAYDHAIHLWTVNNPGKPATIYEVAGFVNSAARAAMIPTNILSAFKATGICPFNDEIFQDYDFAKSTVTHQEAPPQTTDQETPQENEEDQDDPQVDNSNHLSDDEETAAVPGQETTPATSHKGKHVGPREIFGLPHVAPRNTTKKGRRKGKCMVATDTPEKNEIEKRDEEKKKKVADKEERKKLREKRKLENMLNPQKSKKSKKKAVAKTLFVESSDDEESFMKLSDSEEGGEWHESEEEQPLESHKFPALTRKPEEGEYVLVEFPRGKELVYYIGRILSEEDEEGDLQISYLRKSEKVKNKFLMPNVPDLKSVHTNDIKMILPKPTVSGTRRQQNHFYFDIDLSLLKVL